jgi:hypothetical protein
MSSIINLKFGLNLFKYWDWMKYNSPNDGRVHKYEDIFQVRSLRATKWVKNYIRIRPKPNKI